MKQAAILAGGRGTRLSHVFRDIPKSMVPIAGHPLLEIVVKTLAQQGIRDLVLFTGFQSEQAQRVYRYRWQSVHFIFRI